MLHYFLLFPHIRRVLVDLAWLNTADNNLRQGVRYTMAMTSDQIQAKRTAAPGQLQIRQSDSAGEYALVTSNLLATNSDSSSPDLSGPKSPNQDKMEATTASRKQPLCRAYRWLQVAPVNIRRPAA
jgi:hypothetical protein